MRRSSLPILLAVVLLSVFTFAPGSASVDEKSALDRFFRSEELSPDWFAPSFLQAVPFAQLQPIRDQVVGALGEFREVRQDGSRWLAIYEKGQVPTLIELDGEGRFSGLRLLPPVPFAASLEEAASALEEQPGRSSLLVVVDGQERLAIQPDEVMAVGSAFKLVILEALREEVAAGRRSWSDTVELSEELRSLPSGVLQTWPAGSPVTLHTLAALMISQSDNTATDHLLVELGRERVEAADPSGRNRPFLTTADAFRLKDPANIEQLERWREAGESERRAILARLAGAPLPDAAIFAAGPIALDVEWFLSARELCALIGQVADLDLAGINPGVTTRDIWSRVAFKGGSEPGVLNLTTWTRSKSGEEICVCVTQNADAEVDLTAVSSVVNGILEQLR